MTYICYGYGALICNFWQCYILVMDTQYSVILSVPFAICVIMLKSQICCSQICSVHELMEISIFKINFAPF